MTEPDTLASLVRLVAEIAELPIATVRPEGRIAGYGIDSVRAVELAVRGEETFGVQVDEAALAAAAPRTVRDLAAFVERLRAAR